MTTTAVTQRSFDDIVSGNMIVLMEFWRSACGWCTKFAPIYADSSDQHPEIVHATIDTDSEPALAAAAQIRSVPTLLGFREGLLVYSQPGFQTAAQLEDTVQQIRWLDMDMVRRDLAAQQPAAPEQPQTHRPAAAGSRRGAGIAVGPARYGWPGLRVN